MIDIEQQIKFNLKYSNVYYQLICSNDMNEDLRRKELVKYFSSLWYWLDIQQMVNK